VRALRITVGPLAWEQGVKDQGDGVYGCVAFDVTSSTGCASLGTVPDALPHDSAPTAVQGTAPLSKQVLRSVVKEIAAVLGETESLPLQSLRRLIIKRGVAFAQDLLREVQEIEAQGGLMVEMDGCRRRRTLGGIYFFLAKQRLSGKQRRFVFNLPKFRMLQAQRRLAENGPTEVVAPSTVTEVPAVPVQTEPPLGVRSPDESVTVPSRPSVLVTDMPAAPPPSDPPKSARPVRKRTVIEVTTVRGRNVPSMDNVSSKTRGAPSSRGTDRVWRSPDSD
jgi:hypothetical protein